MTFFRDRATTTAREQARRELAIAAEDEVLLFAGKLVPFKRPLDVIEACAMLRRRGRRARVLVAGAGELDAAMRERAAAAGVPLDMLGFCNQSRMPSVYAACDVLVLPSDARETWGLVANEALACHRPVALSAEVGSAADLASATGPVRAAPLASPDALAAAIADLLDAPPPAETYAAMNEAYGLERAARGILEAAAFVAGAQGQEASA